MDHPSLNAHRALKRVESKLTNHRWAGRPVILSSWRDGREPGDSERHLAARPPRRAERWRHIQRHAEMRERQDTLLEAIARPDFQEPDPHPRRERYWPRCRAPFPFRWLRVVVEFAGDADDFVTAFGQDNDPEGLPR